MDCLPIRKFSDNGIDSFLSDEPPCAECRSMRKCKIHAEENPNSPIKCIWYKGEMNSMFPGWLTEHCGDIGK